MLDFFPRKFSAGGWPSNGFVNFLAYFGCWWWSRNATKWYYFWHISIPISYSSITIGLNSSVQGSKSGFLLVENFSLKLSWILFLALDFCKSENASKCYYFPNISIFNSMLLLNFWIDFYHCLNQQHFNCRELWSWKLVEFIPSFEFLVVQF